MSSEEAPSKHVSHSQPQGWERTWLIGAFLASSRTARLSTLYEILFGLLIGTVPFWLGGLVVMAVGRLPDVPAGATWPQLFWLAVQSTFKNGELLIFAVSVIGPALWLSATEPEGATPLPHRRPILAVTFIVVVVCSVLFGLIQAGVLVDAKLVNSISWYFTLVAILFMYLALTYHYFRLPSYDISESVILQDQTKFLTQVKKRRGG